MERLKRFSFRKKKSPNPESIKPHHWVEDEKKVREGSCSFQVRYLGGVEVFESRGMQVCEEAIKALKAKSSRSIWQRMSVRMKRNHQKDRILNNPSTPQCKGKYQRAILYVSGDALRVVDEISKGLIVDQTIEKVSFCAPDRNFDKGFAYICRDGTSRRWMCHGFLALKESGERLSHAVGCAFSICLEKKQKRDKDAASVTVTYNEKGTSFTRLGSFKQATLTERLEDPQSTLIAEPIPEKTIDNPHAVNRPRASQDMLLKQGSFRTFQKLNDKSSPFKRNLSLRLEELPSNLERKGNSTGCLNGLGVATIHEVSPSAEESETISDICKRISTNFNSESDKDDPYLASLPITTHTQIPKNDNSMSKSFASSNQNHNNRVTASVNHHPNPWQNENSDQPDGETWLKTVSNLQSTHINSNHNRSQSVDTANTKTFGKSPSFDPFDAAWAGAKQQISYNNASQRMVQQFSQIPIAPTNPFANELKNGHKTFEVKL